MQELTAEQRRTVDRFPVVLKAIVQTELEAGNTIVHVGAGHPAPPAGDQVMFAQDLTTVDRTKRSGLRFYQRNSSTHFEEVTDDHGFFWVLSSPHPPPPPPDMDAIRAAVNIASPPAPKPAPATFPHGSIELDYRGEMLILHERDRRTDIVWTWNRGNYLYRSSLSPWWYPAERRSEPMSEEEKELVLARFMEYGRAHISPSIELRD